MGPIWYFITTLCRNWYSIIGWICEKYGQGAASLVQVREKKERDVEFLPSISNRSSLLKHFLSLVVYFSHKISTPSKLLNLMTDTGQHFVDSPANTLHSAYIGFSFMVFQIYGQFLGGYKYVPIYYNWSDILFFMVFCLYD